MKFFSLILAIGAVESAHQQTSADDDCLINKTARSCKEQCHFCKNGVPDLTKLDPLTGGTSNVPEHAACYAKETKCGRQGQLATLGVAAAIATLALGK